MPQGVHPTSHAVAVLRYAVTMIGLAAVSWAVALTILRVLLAVLGERPMPAGDWRAVVYWSGYSLAPVSVLMWLAANTLHDRFDDRRQLVAVPAGVAVMAVAGGLFLFGATFGRGRGPFSMVVLLFATIFGTAGLVFGVGFEALAWIEARKSRAHDD